MPINPLTDDKFLDSSKLKEFADDNFKFDENGRKLSKGVIPQCFQTACFPWASKGVIVGEWVKFEILVCTCFNRLFFKFE